MQIDEGHQENRFDVDEQETRRIVDFLAAMRDRHGADLTRLNLSGGRLAVTPPAPPVYATARAQHRAPAAGVRLDAAPPERYDEHAGRGGPGRVRDLRLPPPRNPKQQA
ncbi:hypothetical protein ACH4T9_03450 [Micromonospora sp. NPDC020750]|uniref:hypothetical protein n=1 Tax=unclassified Micromonospora TaxID=2617518 RepID=UPI0037BC3D7B